MFSIRLRPNLGEHGAAMKKLLTWMGFLQLGLALLAGPVARAGDLAAPAPAMEPIRDKDGVVLRNPKILSFNGVDFQVEHDGGVAKIPHSRMPAAIQRKYFPDTEKAMVEEAMRKEAVARAQEQAMLELQRSLAERALRNRVDQARPDANGRTRVTPFGRSQAQGGAEIQRAEMTVQKGVTTDVRLPSGTVVMQFLLVEASDDRVLYRTNGDSGLRTFTPSTGMEGSGKNLTTLAQGENFRISWVNTLRRMSDTGVLLVEYQP